MRTVGTKLTQKQLEKLKKYLASNQEKNNGMNLYEMHGFFTCLAIGPETIMPSSWLPLVLGGGPEIELDDEEVLNLIMAYYNSICRGFAENLKAFKIPLNRENTDEKKTDLTDWALGFFQGIHYDIDFWENFLITDEYKYFYMLLGSQIPEIAGEMKIDTSLFNKEIEIHIERLENILGNIHKDILELRKDQVAATKQIINQPKVGRNDPCPCGSGKKFKKCCMN